MTREEWARFDPGSPDLGFPGKKMDLPYFILFQSPTCNVWEQYHPIELVELVDETQKTDFFDPCDGRRHSKRSNSLDLLTASNGVLTNVGSTYQYKNSSTKYREFSTKGYRTQQIHQAEASATTTTTKTYFNNFIWTLVQSKIQCFTFLIKLQKVARRR